VGRRILLTGIQTFWGGRLARELERDPTVETIIGVGPSEPTIELERTEYVRVGAQHTLLRRIVGAAEIDTVVDTRLVVDSSTASARDAHENNVIGTMNVLAAASGDDSPVRKVVFKSSAHYYGAERDDPAFFTEDMERPHPPATRIERDIVEAERAVRTYAAHHPHVTTTILRYVNGLGPGLRTAHTALLALPAVPCILGFDPRYQFVHEEDIVASLAHATREDLDGTYNVAGDGVLALSEVASLLGRPLAPILPPWGTGLALAPLRRLGLRIPDEMLRQLRYGRGVDNRRLKAAGYALRYTTREAVLRHAEHLRVAPIREGHAEPYRYEREVEDFLRYSPNVRRPTAERALGGYSARELAQLARVLEQVAGERERAGE
jgi:UDP-glucose 4-epimerase